MSGLFAQFVKKRSILDYLFLTILMFLSLAIVCEESFAERSCTLTVTTACATEDPLDPKGAYFDGLGNWWCSPYFYIETATYKVRRCYTGACAPIFIDEFHRLVCTCVQPSNDPCCNDPDPRCGIQDPCKGDPCCGGCCIQGGSGNGNNAGTAGNS